jgi:hypothetical protein
MPQPSCPTSRSQAPSRGSACSVLSACLFTFIDGRRGKVLAPVFEEAGDLERREPLGAPGDHLLGRDIGGGLSRREEEVGLHLLAPHRIGHRDDGGLRDPRMRTQHRLDLAGRDVLARPADDLLAATDEVEKPPLVPPHHVARPVPAAVRRGLGRRVGAVEIAAEEVDAADQRLARFSGATSRPSGSTMRIWTPGGSTPIVPVAISSSASASGTRVISPPSVLPYWLCQWKP